MSFDMTQKKLRVKLQTILPDFSTPCILFGMTTAV